MVLPTYGKQLPVSTQLSIAVVKAFFLELSIIEADFMEILAIVILCVSTLVSFSTSDRKKKSQAERQREYDADLPFTEAYDLESSSGKK